MASLLGSFFNRLPLNGNRSAPNDLCKCSNGHRLTVNDPRPTPNNARNN